MLCCRRGAALYVQVGPGIAEASPRAMLDAAYYGITRHSFSGLTKDEELVAQVGWGCHPCRSKTRCLRGPPSRTTTCTACHRLCRDRPPSCPGT